MSKSSSSQPPKLNYKGVFIILDGLGDRPNPDLDGKTPLEAAQTPTMDQLLKQGMAGMMDPLYPGLPVATHTGTAALLGTPLSQVFGLSRGPVEAAGVGIELLDGDVCLRANFATVKQQDNFLQITDRRAGRINQDTHALAELLQNVKLGEGVRASLTPSRQHRAVLHLSGYGLSEDISDTDPGTRNLANGLLKSQALDSNNPAAVRTAAMLNRFSHIANKRLSQSKINKQRVQQGLLPANAIIVRSAGQFQQVNSIVNHYNLNAALVAADSTALGLGKLLGYSNIVKETFNGLCDTDLAGKIQAVTKALESHDIVFLHVKAPDVASHDLKAVDKKLFLERFDQELASLVNPTLDDKSPLKNKLVFAISGDHSTDSNLGRHVGDPVPSLLYHPAGRSDSCTEYSEKSCMQGGLGRLNSNSLLLSMLDAMGAISQYKIEERVFYQ